MKDFNQQRGMVSNVLATSVRVTMMSGPAVGLAKTFPHKNLSKDVHTSMEGAELAGHTRSAASCAEGAEDEPASKKTAHAPENQSDELV